MSTTAAAITIAGILTVSVPTAYWQIRRAIRHDNAVRDRILRESCTTDGSISPTDPRLPAGVNAWLDDLAALDPVLQPVFAPGLDRLRQAIRDEQNGDTQ